MSRFSNAVNLLIVSPKSNALNLLFSRAAVSSLSHRLNTLLLLLFKLLSLNAVNLLTTQLIR
jgi:hypothetical protein